MQGKNKAGFSAQKAVYYPAKVCVETGYQKRQHLCYENGYAS